MQRFLPLVAVLCAAGTGCKAPVDADAKERPAWVHDQAAKNHCFLREFLNGNGDMQFYDGWYPLENDPKTGGAWRWMDRRGIVRLRTTTNQAPEATDMKVTVFGWVPFDDVGFRTVYMEFAVNGHVLDRFEPVSSAPFEHAFVVPRWLLQASDWVDLSITVTNTAKPRGDWRDLGFATTGIVWKPTDAT
jgi:hypothetical protein